MIFYLVFDQKKSPETFDRFQGSQCAKIILKPSAKAIPAKKEYPAKTEVR